MKLARGSAPDSAGGATSDEVPAAGWCWSVRVLSVDWNGRMDDPALIRLNQVGLHLLDLGYPGVIGLRSTSGSHYVLYVGEASTRAELEPLLERVRKERLPNAHDEKQLKDALIMRRDK